MKPTSCLLGSRIV
jgi:hypothetical protein